MSVIVTCPCNAKVRLPEERLGQRLRCPRCHTEFVATADEHMAVLPTGEEKAGGFCPICQTNIEPGEVAVPCPECRQVHHRECWAEVGGYSTYGCPKAPAVSKPEGVAEAPRAAWGDTKKCPVCAETIKAIALRCRYCGTDFSTVDPLTIADLGKQAQHQETLQGLRTGVWGLFICSLIGCTAPILMVINLAWFLPKRDMVAKAGPLYTALGYASLLIAVIYNLLILFFILFSEH